MHFNIKNKMLEVYDVFTYPNIYYRTIIYCQQINFN